VDSTLTPPEFLNTEAKAEFNRIAPTLAKRGILKATDRAALASYCVAYARLAEAERLIDREGQVIQAPIVSRSGNIVGHQMKRNPAVMNARDYHALMLRASSLFGLSPVDRQRIDAPNEDPEMDELDRFLAECRYPERENLQ
jgi:P27 family predicted phage terminase small subunit